ncbi:radical SAM protein [Candidatus Gracilibacteria bacterium]|nr:radical SAM protein [Candidatus Gracilibacteria bacterium]
MTNHFYIHIPFCKQKCPYCKFALTPVFDEFKKKRYIEYLKKEIKEYFLLSSWGTKDLPKEADSSYCQNNSEVYPVDKKVKTIYFGGGTPSILTSIEIKEILEYFPFYRKTETEITLESNPEDITEEYILSILELGINRISVGVQTLNETSLKEIHRSNPKSIFDALGSICSVIARHEAIQVPDTLDRHIPLHSTRDDDTGKGNKNRISLNTDFILGLPYTKSGEILQGIQELHKSFPNITHTSVYMLEDELYPKYWETNSISENELKTEFLEIIEYFESIGWNHYEFSNWAKPGYESIHNRAYWNHSNSRGFGLSGASYEDGKRWNNSSSFTGYYKENRENEETLTDEQIEIENMMFGLRTGEWDTHTQTIASKEKIQKLINDGLIEMIENKIKPTKTGIFMIDHIMAELLI